MRKKDLELLEQVLKKLKYIEPGVKKFPV